QRAANRTSTDRDYCIDSKPHFEYNRLMATNVELQSFTSCLPQSFIVYEPGGDTSYITVWLNISKERVSLAEMASAIRIVARIARTGDIIGGALGIEIIVGTERSPEPECVKRVRVAIRAEALDNAIDSGNLLSGP